MADLAGADELAIPLQTTIIPVHLLIIELGLHNTPGAIVLPSIAFAIPFSVVVPSSVIRRPEGARRVDADRRATGRRSCARCGTWRSR